jgi:hypothetical protein
MMTRKDMVILPAHRTRMPHAGDVTAVLRNRLHRRQPRR